MGGPLLQDVTQLINETSLILYLTCLIESFLPMTYYYTDNGKIN